MQCPDKWASTIYRNHVGSTFWSGVQLFTLRSPTCEKKIRRSAWWEDYEMEYVTREMHRSIALWLALPDSLLFETTEMFDFCRFRAFWWHVWLFWDVFLFSLVLSLETERERRNFENKEWENQQLKQNAYERRRAQNRERERRR